MDKQKFPSLSLLRDDLIHHLAQGLDIVRFGNDAAEPIAPIFRHDRIVGVAARDRDPGSGIHGQEFF